MQTSKVKKYFFVAAASFSLGLGVIFRIVFSTSTSSAPQALTDVAPIDAQFVSATRANFAQATTIGHSPILPNLDPFASLALNFRSIFEHESASSLARLRQLVDTRTLAEAQLEAAKSDDPLVHAHSLLLTMPCMTEAVQMVQIGATEYLNRHALDPKTGQPRPLIPLESEFAQLRAAGGPQRVHPPESVRAQLKQMQDEPIAERLAKINRGERDYAREMQLWKETRAPLTAEEEKAFF